MLRLFGKVGATHFERHDDDDHGSNSLEGVVNCFDRQFIVSHLSN